MVLDKIRCDDADFIKKTAENFEISETSVRRYIKDCLDKGIVTEDAERQTGLFLTTVSEQWNMANAGMLEEDDLYWTHISPFLGGEIHLLSCETWNTLCTSDSFGGNSN